jgi:hypothetical protein
MSRTVLGIIAVIAAGALLYTYFHNTSAPGANPIQVYSSSELGISFEYPAADYHINLHTEGTAEREWHTLVLIPKDYAEAPGGGEGPPAIAISMFDNIEGLSLEQWVRGDARSNFKLSNDQRLASTSIGGSPALKYSHSGLYETDAIAVSRGSKIYLLSVGWLTPQDLTRADFQDLYTSLQFTN